jgi:hypothetical protein
MLCACTCRRATPESSSAAILDTIVCVRCAIERVYAVSLVDGRDRVGGEVVVVVVVVTERSGRRSWNSPSLVSGNAPLTGISGYLQITGAHQRRPHLSRVFSLLPSIRI